VVDNKIKSYEHTVKKKINKEEKVIKKEEKIIFKEFSLLKRKHQVLFGLIISLGVVFVCRGLWNLLDYYWLVSFPFWSNVTGIIMGLLLLFLSHQIIKQFSLLQ